MDSFLSKDEVILIQIIYSPWPFHHWRDQMTLWLSDKIEFTDVSVVQ